MSETIQLGDLSIRLTRKAVKHVHLSVYPPAGRVTLVAPSGTRLEVARAYAISKLGWIRDQQARLLEQARETPRQFIELYFTAPQSSERSAGSNRRFEFHKRGQLFVGQRSVDRRRDARRQ